MTFQQIQKWVLTMNHNEHSNKTFTLLVFQQCRVSPHKYAWLTLRVDLPINFESLYFTDAWTQFSCGSVWFFSILSGPAVPHDIRNAAT